MLEVPSTLHSKRSKNKQRFLAYFKNIKEAAKTLSKGLGVTLKHIREARKSSDQVGIADPSYFDSFETGINTLQYPHESMPVPDNGRYKLHNEIDDCIVCDKCAKVCPVDCIDIEGIKATEVIGKTSDGTSKRIYAAKFDIDMAKCCFCGLCTTVCPTECLTMTKSYDFSAYDFEDHTYSFATMTPLEILGKKKLAEQAEQEKEQKAEVAAKAEPKSVSKVSGGKNVTARPVFKPRPITNKAKSSDSQEDDSIKESSKSKPLIKQKKPPDLEENPDDIKAKAKPVFKPRPMIKKKKKSDD